MYFGPAAVSHFYTEIMNNPMPSQTRMVEPSPACWSELQITWRNAGLRDRISDTPTFVISVHIGSGGT